jgi:hypothetical protein
VSARELAIVLLRVIGLYLLIRLVTAGPAALWALGYLLTWFGQRGSVVSGVDWLGWSQIAFTICPSSCMRLPASPCSSARRDWARVSFRVIARLDVWSWADCRRR